MPTPFTAGSPSIANRWLRGAASNRRANARPAEPARVVAAEAASGSTHTAGRDAVLEEGQPRRRRHR